MLSQLISTGAIPITLDEIRLAIGLQSHELDGLITAKITSQCVWDGIIPATWAEDEEATERQCERGFDPIAIASDAAGRRLVTYSPTARQVEVVRQKIVIWLLEQDDVHRVREREIAGRLANATIAISTGQTGQTGQNGMTDYELLKLAGHSPGKAAEIVLDAKRHDAHATRWVKILRRQSDAKS